MSLFALSYNAPLIGDFTKAVVQQNETHLAAGQTEDITSS